MKELEARMKQQMEERRVKKLDERVAAYKGRLNLSDAQAAKIRELLDGSPEAGGPKVDVAGEGFSINEPGLEGAKERSAKDAKIAGLLTPEQQQAYDGFKQEQRENRIELATNNDLMNLQRELTLTPEQKDKAFQALRDVAQNEDEMGGSIFDPQVIKSKMEARRNALRPILTPEQMKAYESNPMVNIGGGSGPVIGFGASMPLE